MDVSNPEIALKSEEMLFEILFLPDEKKVRISSDVSILQAARMADIPIVADCGGRGSCMSCKVRLKSGNIRSNQYFVLPEEDSKQGYILACSSYPASDAVVEIPLSAAPRGLKSGQNPTGRISEKNLPYSKGPIVEKYHIKSLLQNEPQITAIDGFYRLLSEKTGIESYSMAHHTLLELSEFILSPDYDITVAITRHQERAEILAVEYGDTSHKNYGIVIDIGTTSLEAVIVEISSGKVIHSCWFGNPQSKYGKDIISRMNFASRGKGLLILNDIIIDRFNEILMQLIEETGISKDNVYSIAISGNTVMMHILMGLSTEPIRKEPHVPLNLSFPRFSAKEINLYVHPEAVVYITPGAGSFVGGDVVSSLISTGMPDEDFALVDIGTNGEVAVVSGGAAVFASTSAGPAFEGAGIKHGVPAIPGAINKIWFDKSDSAFKYTTIDNQPPSGICGTGLIDLLSELFRNGIIDRKGKFRDDAVSNNIRIISDRKEFVIAQYPESKKAISINEQDIDYLVRSKGAMFAGIRFLLEKSGIPREKLKTIYIAGALGGMIDKENAVTIGLFPDLEREKFYLLGNGSLYGGWMLLLSKEAREKADSIVRGSVYFELGNEHDYMNEYTSSLFLPHTHLDFFPSLMRY